ncbi:MAG: type IV pilus modification protein PilV [Gammaproteobacteria bacterium]|nr:type IV pilus modification protein PilV [Gammaproteobacteria bacterium]
MTRRNRFAVARPGPLARRRADAGRAARSRSGGATLIEVLIAVLVLAVGILGLMGLQINGKRTNYEALQRSAAVSLAQDMMNRIRANPNSASDTAFLDTNYDTTALGYAGGGVGGNQITASPPDCVTAGVICSRQQLAVFDLATWEMRLDAAAAGDGLVNPTGCIDVDTSAADGSLVTVIVAWESKVDLDQTTLVARMPVDCGGAGKYGTGNTRRQAVISTTFLANR